MMSVLMWLPLYRKFDIRLYRLWILTFRWFVQ
jgi:hypothetical protein